MSTLWFILVAGMLAAYVVLDGFDLGAGAIHLVAARTDEERRTILRAIGPVWDGNEVWLIAAAGTLFFSFPLLYASSFSGFYLPLVIVLWLLIGRGVAIELRSHLHNRVWASFWDGVFFVGSALLAVFFGAALANVVRGVPLDRHGYFFEPLWTDFNPASKEPGILDWYTILIGALSCAALTIHGAAFISLKTEGAVNRRAGELVRRLWPIVAALTLAGTIATFALRHSMLDRFRDAPWGILFPLIALAGLAAVRACARAARERATFVSSATFLLGMVASTAFALYPTVLPAVESANSLTIHNAAAGDHGLRVGLVWWLIGIALAAVYFAVTYHLFRGKVGRRS